LHAKLACERIEAKHFCRKVGRIDLTRLADNDDSDLPLGVPSHLLHCGIASQSTDRASRDECASA
jgi:hypothetical protein